MKILLKKVKVIDQTSSHNDMIVDLLVQDGIIEKIGAELNENEAETISGKNAVAIHAFNEHVKNDPRTTQVLLTVRDGMLLIQKNEL